MRLETKCRCAESATCNIAKLVGGRGKEHRVFGFARNGVDNRRNHRLTSQEPAKMQPSERRTCARESALQNICTINRCIDVTKESSRIENRHDFVQRRISASYFVFRRRPRGIPCLQRTCESVESRPWSSRLELRESQHHCSLA